jgi:hypothetical protein
MVSSAAVAEKDRSWRRHLDGWQAGALLLLIAASAIFLGVPRAVEPDWLPRPQVDSRSLAVTMRVDDELARKAAREPLDVDVRAVGREIRSYNQIAAAAADEAQFARAREQIAHAARKASSFGEQLAELRAYQLAKFLEELKGWQRTGKASDELIAVSGDFLDTVVRNRWCFGSGRELLVGERELRALFKKRWNAIVGAEGEALALTIDEERLRLGFLAAHPFVGKEAASLETVALERTLAPQRLRTIERLAALDADYPAQLARGVVLFRTQQFQPAADAFRLHLEARPDGPYTLRARNYLKAALDRAVEAGL